MTDFRLETERLILRPAKEEDLPRWAEFAADPDATRFLGGPKGASMSWRALMTMAGAFHLTGVAMFSAIEKTSGLWVGRMGPWRPHGWPGTEVGWSLHPDAQGKGYAYEGATAMIDYAFDVLGWTDVIHCIDPDNLASARLAARLGSTNHGPGRLPPPFENAPVDIWGQSKAEWAKNRKAFVGG